MYILIGLLIQQTINIVALQLLRQSNETNGLFFGNIISIPSLDKVATTAGILFGYGTIYTMIYNRILEPMFNRVKYLTKNVKYLTKKKRW